MRIWIVLAALNGLCGVALGAVGAHAVSDVALAALVEKASLYQLIHAAALLAIAMQSGRLFAAAKLAFLLGMLLFCGSLYGKALLGWPSVLAPAGGMLLMLGWLLLVVAGFRGKPV